MALFTKKAVFFHIPKCGGTWVRIAMANAGIQSREIGDAHATPSEVRAQMGRRFTFAFVRNPLDWYLSFYAFRLQNGWKPSPKNQIDELCSTDQFNPYIQCVLTKLPGYLSRMYESYLDHPPLDFVGRMENLVDDLIHALVLAGEDFNEEAIRRTFKKNVSPMEYKEKFQDADKHAIYLAEKEIFHRFAYRPVSLEVKVS